MGTAGWTLALVGGPGWTSQPVALARSSSFAIKNFDMGGSPYPALSRSALQAFVADVDLDGRSDLVLSHVYTPNGFTAPCAGTNIWNKSVVALSNGDGSFSVVQDTLGCDWARWSDTIWAREVIGDFDHDQLPDRLLFGGMNWDFSFWNTVKLAKGDEADVQHGSFENPIESVSAPVGPSSPNTVAQFGSAAAAFAPLTIFQGQFWHPVKHADEPIVGPEP
jgi:hypothetical protein